MSDKKSQKIQFSTKKKTKPKHPAGGYYYGDEEELKGFSPRQRKLIREGKLDPKSITT